MERSQREKREVLQPLQATGVFTRVESLLNGNVSERERLQESGITNRKEQDAVLEKELVGAEIQTTFGSITIERVIGSGFMGVVCAAEWLDQDGESHTVAVKLIPAHGEGGQGLFQLRHKFAVREAEMMSRLKHIKTFPDMYGEDMLPIDDGSGIEKGMHVIAMQFIDGPNAKEYIQQEIPGEKTDWTTLGEKVASDIERGVVSKETANSLLDALKYIAALGIDQAEAFHHAHQLGISYNDGKLENTLVYTSRKLRNIAIDLGNAFDFGTYTIQGEGRRAKLVHRADPSAELPPELQNIGPGRTPGTYVNPEEAASIEPSRDIGSLGLMIREAVKMTGIDVQAQLPHDHPYTEYITIAQELLDVANDLANPEYEKRLTTEGAALILLDIYRNIKECKSRLYAEATTDIITLAA